MYWHWAQLQYNNPEVQLVKFVDRTLVPFALAFLGLFLCTKYLQVQEDLNCQKYSKALHVAQEDDMSLFLLYVMYGVADDGREILFDLENKTREEIVDSINKTVGKTELVLKRERLEKVQEKNPASFGSNYVRHCMCEVQGQHPCPTLCEIPDYLRGNYRWNHKNAIE